MVFFSYQDTKVGRLFTLHVHVFVHILMQPLLSTHFLRFNQYGHSSPSSLVAIKVFARRLSEHPFSEEICEKFAFSPSSLVVIKVFARRLSEHPFSEEICEKFAFKVLKIL